MVPQQSLTYEESWKQRFDINCRKHTVNIPKDMPKEEKKLMYNIAHKPDILTSYRQHPEQFYTSYRDKDVQYRDKMESSFSGTYS